jgi:Cu2+-exporting ATPase
MKQYSVTGMSCAACSARVEKAVLKVDGVTFGQSFDKFNGC